MNGIFDSQLPFFIRGKFHEPDQLLTTWARILPFCGFTGVISFRLTNSLTTHRSRLCRSSAKEYTWDKWFICFSDPMKNKRRHHLLSRGNRSCAVVMQNKHLLLQISVYLIEFLQWLGKDWYLPCSTYKNASSQCSGHLLSQRSHRTAQKLCSLLTLPRTVM